MRRRADADRADQGDARALPRRTSTAGSPSSRCTRASRRRSPARCADAKASGHSYESEGAVWLRTTTFGDDKDRVLVRSDRGADLLRRRPRVPRGQARPRLRAADHAAGRRPPRLRRADEGRDGGRSARDPDRMEIPLLQFVHIVERGERASMSKRARRVRHARRAAGRDRRRRHALLHAPALARLDDRPRPRPRARGVAPRTPSTTSSTRTRGSPRCCARPATSGSPRRWRRRRGARAGPVRARADQEAAGVPGRGGRGGGAPRAAPDRRLRARAGADVHGVLPRLPGRRRRAARRSSRSGSACASRRGGRSPARSACSASKRRTRCSYSSLKKFRPRPSSALWASVLRSVSSPVKSRTPIAISTAPETAVMIR